MWILEAGFIWILCSKTESDYGRMMVLCSSAFWDLLDQVPEHTLMPTIGQQREGLLADYLPLMYRTGE